MDQSGLEMGIVGGLGGGGMADQGAGRDDGR